MTARPLSVQRERGFNLLSFVATALVTALCSSIGASQPTKNLLSPSKESKHEKHKHVTPKVGGVEPKVSIPLAPLGFAPPASFYMGDRIAQVSLDFLDEETLLFTFRIPGLIERDHAHRETAGGSGTQEENFEERNIRALVLSLPSGKVTAEAVWRLHDLAPYLWVLKDRHFLLRDRDQLQLGDASLHLESFLRFPGTIQVIELDPSQQMMVAQTYEAPAAEKSQSKSSMGLSSSQSEDGAQSEGVASLIATGGPSHPKASPKQNLMRILHLSDRQVLMFTHLGVGHIHLPVDKDGYFEALRGNGTSWNIAYKEFTGSEEPIYKLDSTCYPTLDVLAPGFVMASACTAWSGRKLYVIDRQKRRLWDDETPPTSVWPLVVRSADGTRMARATLQVARAIGPLNPLDRDDIRGQSVNVYDVATGKVALTGPVSPVLDAGGGFALSPSGTHFAVLNEGAIQVFDLPPAPPLPALPPTKGEHDLK